MVEGSVHIPLAELPGRTGEIPHDRPVVLQCAGGHRSSIAACVLRRADHPDVSDLLGGYAAWLRHEEEQRHTASGSSSPASTDSASVK
ncbi:rhodanese-like domain-containing protein [Amycolatopsis sp. NPDC051061]|uniref:rhodanese-like domain-containing protein n=1 Tax=Amycolatopsis sp. NPDC051061 TaxID=3155042 RepID=UPI0034318DC4